MNFNYQVARNRFRRVVVKLLNLLKSRSKNAYFQKVAMIVTKNFQTLLCVSLKVAQNLLTVLKCHSRDVQFSKILACPHSLG